MPFVFNPLTGKLDQTGAGGGNPFDQSLNTTDSVTFDTVHATGAITASSALFGDSESPDYVFVQTDGVFGSSGGAPWGVDATKTIAYWQNANSFTAKQTITAPANTSALTATYSVTGANTTPLLDLSGTWNTTGAARGLKLNITDTASNAASLLADLGIGSRTQYAFTKSRQFWIYNSSPTTQDASNYERGFMRWNSNTLEIGTEAGGTGTSRVTKILSAAQVDVFTFGAVQAARFSSGSSIIYNSLSFGGATLTANPTTSDLAAGRAGVWKNSTTGVVSLWYNDGGTMKSIALV
jgi:hypothetical protein